MKIACFIVVLCEIMKEVYSLECQVQHNDKEPQTKDCTAGEVCSYTLMHDRDPKDPIPIDRGCISIKNDDQRFVMGKCLIRFVATYCTCDTDNCNNNCSADNCKRRFKFDPDKEYPDARQLNEWFDEDCDANCTASEIGQEKNDSTPTDATTTNKTKPTSKDDDAQSTSEDGSQPTEDGTAATGEGGPQPTEDRSGATEEDAEETQTPTGKPSTNSGNLSVVESNQLVFSLWILAILVIRSFYP